MSAERLLEPPYLGPARLAKPCTDSATAPASRREQELENRHRPSVCKGVKVLLTAWLKPAVAGTESKMG